MKLQTSYGTIKYKGQKVYLEVSPDFSSYYYSLIPKYYYANRPRYKPHITIVRSRIESVKQNYGLWKGKVVPFLYLPIIRQDAMYFWIDVWSWHIALLRLELGLGIFRDGFRSYHLTIANLKENK